MPQTSPESLTQALDVEDLRALARGDREALGRLYDRHAAVLIALGVRLLGERREAEDLMHDCFVEAWRHAGEYDAARASVKTWLVLRMRSRCIDRLRSYERTRRDSLNEREETLLGQVSGVDEDRICAGRVKELLVELPEDQRKVILLAFFEGLSSSEIGARLAIPIGTVKSRVRSAMGRLRALLRPGELDEHER